MKKILKKLPIIKQFDEIFTSIDVQLKELQKNRNNVVTNNISTDRKMNIEGLNNIVLMKNQYSRKNLKTKTKIALYTVIIGKYDELRIPEVIEDDKFDYYCVTDNKNLQSTFWNIIYIDINKDKSLQSLDNCRLARFVKTHPHILFPEYEHSLFIDADIKIVNSMYDWISIYNDNKDMLISVHPIRDCLYEEGIICANRKIDDIEIIKNQLGKYKKDGYPVHNGLVMSNVIYRINNKIINDFNERWWQEILNFSKRDQISFNYVLYKTKIDIAISPLNAFGNNYYKKTSHCNGKGISHDRDIIEFLSTSNNKKM